MKSDKWKTMIVTGVPDFDCSTRWCPFAVEDKNKRLFFNLSNFSIWENNLKCECPKNELVTVAIPVILACVNNCLLN